MTQKTPKNAENFICEKCLFNCNKKSDWLRHISTRKHNNDDAQLHKKRQKTPKIYNCDCGNSYSYRQGLHLHKKKCNFISDNKINQCEEYILDLDADADTSKTDTDTCKGDVNTNSEMKLITNLIIEVVKNNQDFQKQMVEMCKTIQTNISMNNCNNNNNTFNMQVFLNEECKDAMNISEFVNSVNIQLEDLENVGRLGYATGMSNIIVKELKMLDVYKRPIHCSDIKRETFYVKDNDVWEKETPENNKMKKAIKGISQKNMIKLNDWRDKHPDCLDSSSSYNDIYLKLMVEACGGRGDFTVGENKILKNIAKEVVIKK
jgi:hypothetical protein